MIKYVLVCDLCSTELKFGGIRIEGNIRQIDLSGKVTREIVTIDTQIQNHVDTCENCLNAALTYE